jgi:hypothetical protein
LIVSNMRYLLGKASHVRRRFEAVVFFRHLFRGSDEIVPYALVVPLKTRAQGAALGMQRTGGNAHQTDKACAGDRHRPYKKSIHGEPPLVRTRPTWDENNPAYTDGSNLET